MLRLATCLATVFLAAAAMPLVAAESAVSLNYHEPYRPVASPAGAQKLSTHDRAMAFEAFGKRYDLALTEFRGLTRSLASEATGVAFRGELDGVPGSWARISFIDGSPQGLIFDGEQLIAIERRYEDPAPIVFRVEDLVFAPGALGCDVHDHEHTGAELIAELVQKSQPEVFEAAGATQQIDIGIVADSEFANRQGLTANADLVARMNVVDGIFSDQLGVQMNLGSVEVLTGNADPFSATTDAGDLLDEVVTFRNTSAAQRSFGLTHLFTGRNLDGTTAGIAFLDALCRNRFGVGLTQATFGPTTDSLVAAHEFGHNFGAPHDGEDGSPCASTPEDFLMAPRVSNSSQFSNCSIQQIQPSIAQAACITGLASADLALSVVNPPQGLADSPVDVVFTATNVGTTTVADTVVTIPITNGLTLDDVSGSNGAVCTSGAGSAQCTIASLGAGAAVDMTVSVVAPTAGTRTLNASLSSPNDENAGNDNASTSVAVLAAVDLTTSASSGSATLNAMTTLSVTVNNTSDDTASGVAVTLTPNAGLDIEAARGPGGSTCVISGGVATCELGQLAAAGSASIDVDVIGTATGGQSFVAMASSSTAETNPANNAATASLTVSSQANAGDQASDSGGGGGAVSWLLVLLAGLQLGRLRRRTV